MKAVDGVACFAWMCRDGKRMVLNRGHFSESYVPEITSATEDKGRTVSVQKMPRQYIFFGLQYRLSGDLAVCLVTTYRRLERERLFR